MGKESINKQLRKLEEDLVKKFDPLVEDGVIDVEHETNWQNGNFMDVDFFNRLLENITLVEIRKEAEIKVGQKNDPVVFKSCLHNTAAKKIVALRRKQRIAVLASLLFLIIGVGVMILSANDMLVKLQFLDDTVMILSWVFLWAAFEKGFFEAPVHVYEIRKILMLCNATVER